MSVRVVGKLMYKTNISVDCVKLKRKVAIFWQLLAVAMPDHVRRSVLNSQRVARVACYVSHCSQQGRPFFPLHSGLFLVPVWCEPPDYFTAVILQRRVLRIFGPKRDKVTGECYRKLHNEEFHDLYSSSTILRVIKSRRMR
jgi:hypothetical protein